MAEYFLDLEAGRYRFLVERVDVPPPPPPPLSVEIAGDDRTGEVGESLAFQALAVSGGVPPVMLLWEWGDGTTSAGQQAIHTYDTPGNYTITLTAMDAAGVLAADKIYVDIVPVPPPPPTSFIVDLGPDIFSTEHLVTFGPVILCGVPPYAISFDYGDGSSGVELSHTYVNGTYLAVVSVLDAVGSIATDIATVRVDHVHVPPPPPPPAGDFIDTGHDLIPRYANPTVHQIRDGQWSDPSTWDRVPTDGDIVEVTGTVTISNIATARLLSLEIAPGGRVRHSTAGLSTLTTSYLLNLGTYEMGTMLLPVTGRARLVIADSVPADAEQFLTGFINLGQWSAHGTVRTPWAKLANPLPAGGMFLTLESPVNGWAAGHELALSGNDPVSYVGGTETATIATISSDRLVIGLTLPLRFDHPASAEQLSYVANLSRTIEMRSEDPTGNRGHVMMTGAASWDVSHVRFHGLGRTTIDPLDPATNHIARYPFHTHHAHGTGPKVLTGCSFDDADMTHRRKWPVTIHGTTGSSVQNNVVYNWAGMGITVEDDSARDNIISDNLIILVRGSGQGQDNGQAGTGFGAWGTVNTIRRNIAANCDYSAYEHFGATADPLQDFSDNIALNCGQGWVPWSVGNAGTVSRLSVYGGPGMQLSYPIGGLILDGFKVRCPAPVSSGGISALGMNWGDYPCVNAIIRNADIRGVFTGIVIPPLANWGRGGTLEDHAPGTFTVEDSFIDAVQPILRNTLFSGSGAAGAPPRKTVLQNVRFNPATAIKIICAFLPGEQSNYLAPDTMEVYSHDGSGETLRVYYREQRGDFILPALTPSNTSPTPPAGLTNAQLAAEWEWRLSLDPFDWQYRRKDTVGPGSLSAAGPWRPVCLCSELLPAGAVDGLDYGIEGMVLLVP